MCFRNGLPHADETRLEVVHTGHRSRTGTDETHPDMACSLPTVPHLARGTFYGIITGEPEHVSPIRRENEPPGHRNRVRGAGPRTGARGPGPRYRAPRGRRTRFRYAPERD